jgi:hypothetical protein
MSASTEFDAIPPLLEPVTNCPNCGSCEVFAAIAPPGNASGRFICAAGNAAGNDPTSNFTKPESGGEAVAAISVAFLPSPSSLS